MFPGQYQFHAAIHDFQSARGRASFQEILARFRGKSTQPMLRIPRQATQFRRALLANDGSPHAGEALFVAAYFAEMGKTEVIVFTALDGSRVQADVPDHVRRYLDLREVGADYIIKEHGAIDQFEGEQSSTFHLPLKVFFMTSKHRMFSPKSACTVTILGV